MGRVQIMHAGSGRDCYKCAQAVHSELWRTVDVAARLLLVPPEMPREMDGQMDDRDDDPMNALRAELESVRASDTAKTTFLRMASHELRTPLQALHLQLTRLDRMMPDRTPEIDKVIQGMKRSARRMNDLCDSVQTYAQVESGRLEVEPEDFEPLLLVRQVIDDVRAMGGTNVPEIQVLSDKAPAWFRTDPALFRSAVSNLLTTSIKVASRTLLELEIAETPAGLRISLADNAGGIPESERHFFGDTDPTSRGELSALGLGPVLLREILDALGGTVGLQGVGSHGARLTITMPRIDDPAHTGSSEPAALST
jgi:signal transduction histidine kinase